MVDSYSKSFDTPDDTVEMPGVTVELIDLGDVTVGRTVHQPGWRWSTHVRPIVGGEWCQARHVGVVASGRLGVLLSDGTTLELGPDDVYDIPPGHDGYVIGHEPVVVIEWTGLRTFTGYRAGMQSRVLATLMITDLAGSTAKASEVGDVAWGELLSSHFEAARSVLERFRGHEVKTTGDGMIATFDGPAQALRCAAGLRHVARRAGLHLRAGVHVGEVEFVSDDVRGIAVHEAERITAAAAQDEILVSETTRALAVASGLSFVDRGTIVLKGLPGESRLFAYSAADEVAL